MNCAVCNAELQRWSGQGPRLAIVCGRCATEASITLELVEYMLGDDLLPSDVHEGPGISVDSCDDWRASVLSERPKLNRRVMPERGFVVFDKMGGSSWHGGLAKNHGLVRGT